jgi:hypothetical protein
MGLLRATKELKRSLHLPPFTNDQVTGASITFFSTDIWPRGITNPGANKSKPEENLLADGSFHNAGVNLDILEVVSINTAKIFDSPWPAVAVK